MSTKPMPVRERIVVANTVAIAVFERGEASADRPTVVLAHGWPDAHDVWDLVADRLAADFHVVSFDARGCGASTPGLVHQPFSLDKMAADIDAVIEAVSPDRPVHLVGHDWGSVEGWEYVMTESARSRLASFTSLSGPNLDYMGHSTKTRFRRPTPANLAPVLAQLVKSGYTIVLSMPVIRTLIWRLGLARAFRHWLRVTEGIDPADGYPGSDLARNAIGAVGLYRTNIWPKVARPNPRRAVAPVHLIVATKDAYVSPRPMVDIPAWVDDFTRTEVAAGHWSPRTHPGELAAIITDYIAARTGAARTGEARA